MLLLFEELKKHFMAGTYREEAIFFNQTTGETLVLDFHMPEWKVGDIIELSEENIENNRKVYNLAKETDNLYNECGRKWANVCRAHHLQMCHECERLECHDNLRMQFSKDYFWMTF